MLGRGGSQNDVPVRKHDLHLQNHIVNLAVFRGHHADAAVRKEAPNRGAGQRGRVVHGRLAHLICGILNVLIDSTRAAFDVHSLGVDLINPVHPLGIEQNAAADRNRAALRAAARAPDRHGNFIIVRNFHNLGDLGRIQRADHKIRLRHPLSPVCPHPREPVVIHAVRHLVNRARGAVFLSHRVLQFGQNHGEQKIVHLILHRFFSFAVLSSF